MGGAGLDPRDAQHVETGIHKKERSSFSNKGSLSMFQMIAILVIGSSVSLAVPCHPQYPPQVLPAVRAHVFSTHSHPMTVPDKHRPGFRAVRPAEKPQRFLDQPGRQDFGLIVAQPF